MAIKIFDQIEMCNTSILMVAISMKMIFLLVFISQSFIIKSRIQRMILCTFFPFSLLTTIGYRLSTVQIFVGMPSRGFVILQYLIFEKAYLISCSTPIADVDSIWKKEMITAHTFDVTMTMYIFKWYSYEDMVDILSSWSEVLCALQKFIFQKEKTESQRV